MKESILKNILVNLRTGFSTNIRHKINQNTSRIVVNENAIEEINARFLCLDILDYYVQHEQESKDYLQELQYLRQTRRFCNFPYPTNTQPLTVNSGFDRESKLPYVIHNNKKLFFPSNFSVNDAANAYSYYIQTEKLLGVGDDGNAPHQYQSSNIHVEENDVVFDIGAAEGIFALDQIEKASHVFIVECDSKWIEPLRNTFAPYKNKITIIQKPISPDKTKNTMSLEELISLGSPRNNSSAFIKMDIEGFELPTLASAVEILKKGNGIKFAVATYHKQNDADEIKSLLDKMGYISEFSTGYMLFNSYDTPTPPYFRKGIIRAKK